MKIPAGGKIIKKIEVQGFDSMGEPLIEVNDNGTIELFVNFMPPDNGIGDRDFEPFEYFDKEPEFATGKPVIWDDREHFIFPETDKKTVRRLKRYLDYYWDPYLKSDREYINQDIYGININNLLLYKLVLFCIRIPLEIGSKLLRMRTFKKRKQKMKK